MLLLYPREQSVSGKFPPPQEKYLYQTLHTNKLNISLRISKLIGVFNYEIIYIAIIGVLLTSYLHSTANLRYKQRKLGDWGFGK